MTEITTFNSSDVTLLKDLMTRIKAKYRNLGIYYRQKNGIELADYQNFLNTLSDAETLRQEYSSSPWDNDLVKKYLREQYKNPNATRLVDFVQTEYFEHEIISSFSFQKVSAIFYHNLPALQAGDWEYEAIKSSTYVPEPYDNTDLENTKLRAEYRSKRFYIQLSNFNSGEKYTCFYKQIDTLPNGLQQDEDDFQPVESYYELVEKMFGSKKADYDLEAQVQNIRGRL